MKEIKKNGNGFAHYNIFIDLFLYFISCFPTMKEVRQEGIYTMYIFSDLRQAG